MNWNIKIAWRNILKSKLASTINIVGISIGLSTCLLLFSYVNSEFSTDSHFENYERIYRVQSGEDGIWLPYNAVDVMRNTIPEIEKLTCYHKSFSKYNIVSYNEQNYTLDDVILADADFLKVFDYKLLFGNEENCLDVPNSLILGKKEAERIFGDENPIGKTVNYTTTGRRGGTFAFTITAVLDELPQNTSINFRNIISQSFNNKDKIIYQSLRNWNSSNFITHVVLSPNSDIEKVTASINTNILSALPQNHHNREKSYKLNPLKGIYFESLAYWATTQNTGKKSVVLVLGVIGILILLLAGINYFNLMLAQSKKMGKTVATNRIVGANTFSIFLQSVIETGLLLSVATVISIFIIWSGLSYFNTLTDKVFTINEVLTKNLFIYAILFIPLLIFGTLPSLLTNKENIVGILKGTSVLKHNTQQLKYGLVVLQFVITIALIISVLLVNKQNNFLLGSDYRMDKEQIYCIQLNPSIHEKLNSIEQEFNMNPNVLSFSYGYDHYGDFAQGGYGRLMHEEQANEINFSVDYVAGDFINLFNLNLLYGRSFGESKAEENNIIVNKAFVEKCGLSVPLHSSVRLNYARQDYNIVGVVDDFHYKTKHHIIEPIVFMHNKPKSNVMFVKVNPSSSVNMHDIIKGFKKTWEANVQLFPFEGEYLDDHFESLYQSEQRFMKILFTFSVLSIFIGCLGLFGISVFINQMRTSEIGIRKVNGAKVSEILAMLNKDFVKWVAIAFGIACPIAYYAMNKWLENFAYKTTLSWWIFALAGVLALGIALLTVSWQSWRAATRNPVEALRYE